MIYAFTNVTLLDGTTTMEPQPNMAVVTDNSGRISQIEPMDAVSIPSTASVIDLEGKYLMPGLVNMHVHLAGTGEPMSSGETSDLVDRLADTAVGKAYIRMRIKRSAQNQLMSGVTTVRDVGDLAWQDIAVRDNVNRTRYLGPRILCAGWGVTPQDGHGRGIIAYECRSILDAMNLVEQVHKRGADFVKTFITGGVFDAEVPGEPGVVRMSQRMADAVVARAHELGMTVAAHVESTEGVRVALRAGVDTIEHGSHMDEEIVSLFRENGAGRESCLVCTMSPAMPLAILPGEKTHSTEVVVQNAKVLAREMAEGVRQAREAGIRVGLGTDSGCPYITQYDMWRELVYFHEVIGASTQETLHTATQVNAELLGVGAITGSVQVGKSADLIVCAENPLENLETLRNVQMVMIRGMLVRHPKVKRFPKLDAELDEILHAQLD